MEKRKVLPVFAVENQVIIKETAIQTNKILETGVKVEEEDTKMDSMAEEIMGIFVEIFEVIFVEIEEEVTKIVELLIPIRPILWKVMKIMN